MVLHGKLSIGIMRKSAFGPAVTLTFNLLTSKCNQFIFVPNCTEVVSLVKFPQTRWYRFNRLISDHIWSRRDSDPEPRDLENLVSSSSDRSLPEIAVELWAVRHEQTNEQRDKQRDRETHPTNMLAEIFIKLKQNSQGLRMITSWSLSTEYVVTAGA